MLNIKRNSVKFEPHLSAARSQNHYTNLYSFVAVSHAWFHLNLVNAFKINKSFKNYTNKYNKKVLLHECNRHTNRRVASTRHAAPVEGTPLHPGSEMTPLQAGVPPSQEKVPPSQVGGNPHLNPGRVYLPQGVDWKNKVKLLPSFILQMRAVKSGCITWMYRHTTPSN